MQVEVSERKHRNYVSKVKKHCYGLRRVLQTKHQERANWLYAKYRGKKEWPYINDELKRYDQCEIVKEDCRLEAHA